MAFPFTEESSSDNGTDNPPVPESAAEIEKVNQPLVERVQSQSVQVRSKNDDVASVVSFISGLFTAADTLPRWWSAARDNALDELWKTSDLQSGAMYTMSAKMSTIPFHVEPRDMSITSHLRDAEQFEQRLHDSAEWGKGWGEFFEKQVISLLGQDNGRFMEIIDLSKNKNGPLIGPAISVAHLDPARCTRTSNPKFPINYRDTSGKIHRLHHSRVAFNAQLPSIHVEMHGVGLCAVSRSASYAQNMLDIAKYKEEKMGVRPHRSMLVVGGGLDGEGVGKAIEVTNREADSRNQSRFSLTPIVGDPMIEKPTVELIDFASIPDGFDDTDSHSIAMAAIALAFGVDARELWPGMQQGSTRADALLSHIKQRGKGPGHILQETERMFNNWYLPSHLRMVFDFQDDAQDRQKAEIRHERSQTRKTDIDIGVSSDRVERERMVKEGELTTAQFKDLELSEGRLPDGTPLEVLFFRPDTIYQTLLTISEISDPLDLRSNDPEKVLDAISKKIPEGYELLSTENRQIQSRQIRESIAALEFIQSLYEDALIMKQEEELQAEEVRDQTMRDRGPKANAESENAINARPDDENNSASENSPRELKEMTNVNLKQALQKVRNRKTSTPTETIAKALEELALENIPEPLQPIVNVEVNMPEQKAQPIFVNVEQPEAPPPSEVIVQAPKIEIPAPIVNVAAPNVTIEKESPPPQSKEKETELDEKITFERDSSGEIVSATRKKSSGK